MWWHYQYRKKITPVLPTCKKVLSSSYLNGKWKVKKNCIPIDL